MLFSLVSLKNERIFGNFICQVLIKKEPIVNESPRDSKIQQHISIFLRVKSAIGTIIIELRSSMKSIKRHVSEKQWYTLFLFSCRPWGAAATTRRRWATSSTLPHGTATMRPGEQFVVFIYTSWRRPTYIGCVFPCIQLNIDLMLIFW